MVQRVFAETCHCHVAAFLHHRHRLTTHLINTAVLHSIIDTSFLPMPLTLHDPLIPDRSPFTRDRWHPIIEDEQTQSYAYHLPQQQHQQQHGGTATNNTSTPFEPEQINRWFHELHPSSFSSTTTTTTNTAWTDAFYQNQHLLRKTAWILLNDACRCDYGYSDTWQSYATCQKMIRIVRDEITPIVSQLVGLDDGVLNCCNLNYYPQGGGVGFHADDEFLFDGLHRDTRIVSLSLCCSDGGFASKVGDDGGGGARKFQVRRKSGDGNDEGNDAGDKTFTRDVLLRHGDIMTMEGYFQKYYLHSVWPGDCKNYLDHPLTQGERINLTWRTIVKHLDGSDECRGMRCPLSERGD